jgi:hypothetical protein
VLIECLKDITIAHCPVTHFLLYTGYFLTGISFSTRAFVLDKTNQGDFEGRSFIGQQPVDPLVIKAGMKMKFYMVIYWM